MTVALYWWRATGRTAWRPALVVVLLTSVLGAVSLAALAGARRTESAYGRYLEAVHASDVMVNIPSPDTSLIARVEQLPGVRTGAAWAGLAANPVVRGRVDDSFITNSVSSSVDGAFYRQDTLTVLSGRLPHPDSSGEIALTPAIARLFGVGVGGTVHYRLYDAVTQKAIGAASFRVTALVEAPPALVDQFDEMEGAFLSPAATARYHKELSYSWVGIRLDRGTAGLPSFQSSLTRLSTRVGQDYAFEVRRMDTVHRQVQNAIRPQAVALAVFGGLAALALLVLVGQSLAQWLQRSAGSLRTLRAFGLTRREAAVTCALGPALAVVAGVALAVRRRHRPVTPGAPGAGAAVRPRTWCPVRSDGAGGRRPDFGGGAGGPVGHDGLESGTAPPRYGHAIPLGSRPGRRGRRRAPGGRPRHPLRAGAGGRCP